jgi:tetratricopeptide (TPR) repeat protein
MLRSVRGRGFGVSCYRLVVAGFFVSQLLVSTPAAHGQLNPNSAIGLRRGDATLNPCDQGRKVVVTVLDDKKAHLDRQAVVKLQDEKRNLSNWQTTSAESELTFCNVELGNYDLEVSAVGYLTEHKELQVFNSLDSSRLEVVLHKDPSAVELSAADDAIPTNARKDTNRAVSALKSGNLKEAQKRLDQVQKFAPSSGQINFLYGYLFLQLNDLEKAESYLGRAATLNPHRVQTLTFLGRVQLQRQHYADAQKSLEQAVAVDSGYWMAHNLLADVYLAQKEYEKAREQAQIAIDQGKGAANVAQIILGQALVGAGRSDDGVQTLKTFLQANPDNPAKSQVQDLIAETEKPNTAPATSEVHADVALAASPPALSATAWAPPGVDDARPYVAAGVSCPTKDVIEASGERVKELVDNITRFAAIEDLMHEQLDSSGNPISKETRKFDYVASITGVRPGLLSTDEYRDIRYGVSDLPDGIVTVGFVTLALIFHPDMRDDYQMTCEGLGSWHGQATWLMYFRQRDDKPSRFAEYKVGHKKYPMKLKGRAWITAKQLRDCSDRIGSGGSAAPTYDATSDRGIRPGSFPTQECRSLATATCGHFPRAQPASLSSAT